MGRDSHILTFNSGSGIIRARVVNRAIGGTRRLLRNPDKGLFPKLLPHREASNGSCRTHIFSGVRVFP